MADFYSRLLELRRAEGASRGLAKMPSDFYPQARAYLAEIRRTYETELRENPSGRKGDLARQTHSRAQQVARDLVEARTTKILQAAFQAAVGGSRELPGGLAEERVLFERVVETLREFRVETTPYLESSPVPPARPASAPTASVPAPAPSTPEAPARAATAPVLVRILKASPPVQLGGETLELRGDDVLSLAPDVARILIDGQVAERIRADGRELTP
jgi:DNA replication initiation complex subunit (GINS family)